MAAALVSSVVFVKPAEALEGSWYAGAAVGVSRLSPDTDGSGFTLDEETSTAAGLYLGLDINEWMSLEAAYTDLGKAGLSGDESVDYSALSFGGVAYVLGETDARRRQDDWSGYVRFGLNSISNDSGLDLEKEDNTALWLGAGVQWPIGPSWGVRGELTSFDGDAQAALASIYWRPSAAQRSSRPDVALPRTPTAVPQPPSAPSAKTPTVPATPPVPTTPPEPAAPPATPPSAPEALPSAPVIEAPSPVTSEQATATCAVPATGEPVDAQGCALFSGVLQGVEFIGDTATLTPVGETLLARLAGSLQLYPELIVEIRVHTQTYPQPELARSLSRERAVAVARFLVGEGVDVKRLRARAFGSSQPRAGNNTPGGRRLNNRVELRVL
jgi:outer membrane protein OmpA-like peptidoglycan-associated protein